MLNIKFTPEAFFVLPLAIGIDLAELILLCFALDDFGTLDILGTIFFNIWLLLRGKKSQPKQGKKGVIANIKNLFTGETSKFVVPTLGEWIPYLGALPFWTILVLSNLGEE